MAEPLIETESLDPALAAFLRAADESAAQTLLTVLLVDRIEPILERVLRSRLSELWRASAGRLDARAADLRSEALVQVIRRLRALRDGTGGDPIRNLDGYVATVGRNVCWQYLRQRRPGGEMEGEVAGTLEALADPTPDARESLGFRSSLRALWVEIRQLPERQRAALLLGLRDDTGRSVLFLLPATGTASIREIAAALGWSAERLAGLWNDLPLNDHRIADLLSASRQQIINLRKSARERLGRRMRMRESQR